MRHRELFCVPASVVRTAWGHPICTTTRWVRRPGSFLNTGSDHVSTTGSPTRIQTWFISSLLLGDSLPPWVTN
eukprot:3292145-Ditylum_brightwellii.AAC.1